jgi:hypothetical protein
LGLQTQEVSAQQQFLLLAKKKKTQISKSQQHFVANQNLVLTSKCEEGIE